VGGSRLVAATSEGGERPRGMGRTEGFIVSGLRKPSDGWRSLLMMRGALLLVDG